MPKIILLITFFIVTSCRSMEIVVNPMEIGIDGKLAIIQGARDRILEINLSNGKLSTLKRYHSSMDYIAYVKKNRKFPIDYDTSNIIMNNSKTSDDELIVLFTLDLTSDNHNKIKEYKFDYSSNYSFVDSLNATIPEQNFKSVLFYDENHTLVHDLNQENVKLINLKTEYVQDIGISFRPNPEDQIQSFILTNFLLIDERWVVYVWKKYGKLIVENNQIRVYDLQTDTEYIIFETKGVGGPVIKDIDYHMN